MDNSFYDVAGVSICDPVLENRSSTRSVLYALGCRDMETAGSLREFAAALERTLPDIALCEAACGADEVGALIRIIRQGDPRYNPFTVIIVTSWHSDAQLAAQMSNAGADSLLLRPFSAAQLRERIEALAQRKRRFVVSSSYIGPERRAEPARESEIISFEAPDTLKIKMELRAFPEDAARRVNIELARGRARLAAARTRFAMPV
jgi:DNA-binding NarL/FixJ family response regulator